MNSKLSFKTKIGYGTGALSYGIPVQLVTGLFVFYSTVVLHLPGTVAGLIVFVSILWDAVTDPFMGYISDKTSNSLPFGRRLFYVFIGAVGLATCNYFLWSVDPAATDDVKITELAILILLHKTFSTVLTTPYLALGSELTSDYTERTSVQSYRTAFFFLGYIFPSLIGMAVFFRPTELYENGQLNPGAYPPLGAVASAICIISAAVCIFFTYKKGAIPAVSKKRGISFAGLLRETFQALKCDDYRNISLSLMFINMAMGIVGSVGLHVFTYTFGFDNKQIAVVFGSLFAMALLAQPAWVLIAKKYEKRAALKACIWLDIAVSVLFAVLVFASEWVSENYLFVLPVAMVMGFSMGGSVSLPYSMISDTIDKDEYYNSARKEGVFYGCATFMYKFSQAASAFIIGLFIDIIGFDSTMIQPHGIYLQLGIILPVGFLLCFAASLLFTRRYTLDRKAVSEYQQGIKERSS